MAGVDVMLMDTSGRALKRAQEGISSSLHRAVQMERLTADQAQAAITRIQPQEYLEVGNCTAKCYTVILPSATISFIEACQTT